jgi:hypothetical protein
MADTMSQKVVAWAHGKLRQRVVEVNAGISPIKR